MGMAREKARQETACYALLAFPAVALGVLAMIHGGVSPALWGQQIAAFAVFALMAALLRRAAARIPHAGWCVLLVIVLAASLFGQEAGGARRWLELGVLSVNAAMLVLPAMLVALCGMERPYPAMLATAAVLCIQPDLSQLTAFTAASAFVLWQKRGRRLWSMGTMLLLGLLLGLCMRIPTALEPISYSEGIVAMLGDCSGLLMALGIAALFAVPSCFAYRYARERRLQFLCLSIYYAGTMLFALFAEYPVPLMGFGLSSIAGYWLMYMLMRPCGGQTA